MSHTSLRYRADIDGLRAVAVALVILYHLDLATFSGGFVGVDVFFVISGYLITAMVVADIDARSFSFRQFYLRRLRRLGPSLLVVLGLTLVSGYAVLGPDHLVSHARAALNALVSTSNILFWSESGYFDTAGIYKPLLHTWSLGVEEQFYLVWPALMLFVSRSGRSSVRTWLMLGLFAFSLLATEYVLRRDASAAFYHMPFRVSEFAWGAVIALTSRFARTGLSANLSAATGIALILASAMIYSTNTAFPGLTAQVPAAGAALLIFAGPLALVNRVLGLAPVRYVGKISYSLYLVHWPIIVFFAYLFNFPNSILQRTFIVVLSVALAVVLYHFVETPFRRRRDGTFALPTPALLACTGSAFLAVALVASTMLAERGFPGRIAPSLQQAAAALKEAQSIRPDIIRRGTCHVSKTMPDHGAGWPYPGCVPERLSNAIVVMGDSHGADLWAALAALYPDRQIIQATGVACSIARSDKKVQSHCPPMRRAIDSWLNKNRANISLIIYTQRGAMLLNGDRDIPEASVPDPATIDKFVAAVRSLQKYGTKVMVFGPRPELHPTIDVLMARSLDAASVANQIQKASVAVYLELDKILRNRFLNTPIRYVSEASVICPDGACQFLDEDGMSLIVDYGHWTPEGGKRIVSRIIRAIPDLQAEFETRLTQDTQDHQ